MLSTAPIWPMSWYGPVITPSSNLSQNMWINTLSFESFVDRCCEKTLQYMTWLWFHYDRGIVSCMVETGFVREGWQLSQPWNIHRIRVIHITTNQYTSHGIPNDQWQLIITSFRTRYKQRNRCWSEAHLGTGHVLATADMSPRAIRHLLRYMDWCRLSRV